MFNIGFGLFTTGRSPARRVCALPDETKRSKAVLIQIPIHVDGEVDPALSRVIYHLLDNVLHLTVDNGKTEVQLHMSTEEEFESLFISQITQS